MAPIPGSPSFQPMPNPLASMAATRRSSAAWLSARSPTRRIPEVAWAVSFSVCRS